MKKMSEIIKLINDKYNKAGAVDSAEFDGREDGVWLRGTEEFYLSDGEPVLSYGYEVHPEFQAFIETLGLFAEPYDLGTLMLYRD